MAEVAELAPPIETEPMADFLAALVQAEEPPKTEPTTEQVPEGDETPALEDPPGEEAPPEEKPAEPPKPEGPSAEMQQIARLVGVRDRLIATARDNEQLKEMIEDAQQARAEADPKDEEETQVSKDLDWDLELPEDEYGPDDPLRKQLKIMQDKFKASIEKDRLALAHLLKDERERKETQVRQETEAMQRPLDEALDSFGHDSLGKSDALTQAQFRARAEIWGAAMRLGMNPKMPPEEVQRYTLLAAEALYPKVAEQRKQSQRNAQQQPKRVIGGAPSAKTVEAPQSLEEMLGMLREGKLDVADL